MLQGLSVHRVKCSEKGVIRAIMIFICSRTFVIFCLQFHCTEKVVQLRSSTASRYRAYLVNSMRFSIWKRANMWDPRHHGMELFVWVICLDIRIQNQGNLVYQYCRNHFVSVWQLLARMPWRSAGNGSGSTASWHRVSACNSVSHLEVSKQLYLSAPVVEGIVACCSCRLKQWPVVLRCHGR